MKKLPTYLIQTTWMQGTHYLKYYVEVSSSTGIPILTPTQEKATPFHSSVLAQGWLLKIQKLYPNYRCRVIHV